MRKLTFAEEINFCSIKLEEINFGRKLTFGISKSPEEINFRRKLTFRISKSQEEINFNFLLKELIYMHFQTFFLYIKKSFENICKSNPKKYFPMEFESEIFREPQKKYFRYFKIIGTRNATDNTLLPANLLIFSIILLSNNIMKYTHSLVYIAVKCCKILKHLIRLVSASI